MEDENLTPLPPEAAIGVSFQIPLEGAQPGVQIRMLALQTHIPQSMPEGEMNEVLDRLHRVADRQFKVRELEMLMEQKRLRSSQLEQSIKDLNEKRARAEANWQREGNRSSFKMVGKEKADYENSKREIENWHHQLERLDEMIERVRKAVENASASATDSS